MQDMYQVILSTGRDDYAVLTTPSKGEAQEEFDRLWQDDSVAGAEVAKLSAMYQRDHLELVMIHLVRLRDGRPVEILDGEEYED